MTYEHSSQCMPRVRLEVEVSMARWKWLVIQTQEIRFQRKRRTVSASNWRKRMRSASERKMSCFSLPRFQTCQKPLSTSGRKGRAIARRGSLGGDSCPRKLLEMAEELPFRGEIGGFKRGDSTRCRDAGRKEKKENPAPIRHAFFVFLTLVFPPSPPDGGC